jgi:5'-nucleotidase
MRLFYLAPLIAIAQATNIVLTNDDGWAVALVRAQNNALKAAGYSVRLHLHL